MPAEDADHVTVGGRHDRTVQHVADREGVAAARAHGSAVRHDRGHAGDRVFGAAVADVAVAGSDAVQVGDPDLVHPVGGAVDDRRDARVRVAPINHHDPDGSAELAPALDAGRGHVHRGRGRVLGDGRVLGGRGERVGLSRPVVGGGAAVDGGRDRRAGVGGGVATPVPAGGREGHRGDEPLNALHHGRDSPVCGRLVGRGDEVLSCRNAAGT